MWQQLKSGPVIYAGQWASLVSGHFVVIVGISDTNLPINNPLKGLEFWDYDFFMGQYLLQSKERPLIFGS